MLQLQKDIILYNVEASLFGPEAIVAPFQKPIVCAVQMPLSYWPLPEAMAK